MGGPHDPRAERRGLESSWWRAQKPKPGLALESETLWYFTFYVKFDMEMDPAHTQGIQLKHMMNLPLGFHVFELLSLK